MRCVRTPGRYYDRDGLILTVSPGGGKSWSQRITIDGRRRDVGLGSAHLITPAQARKAAITNRDMVRAGGNPLARDERQPERLKEGRGRVVTFAAYNANRYRRLRAVTTRRDEAERTYARIRKHVNPVIGRRALTTVTSDAVADLLEALAETSRETARWVRAELVKIFTDAEAEGLLEINPARSDEVLQAPGLVPVRVDQAHEWRALLNALPAFLSRIEQDPRRPASFLLIRFCLLTARHPMECRLATWSQIDMAGRILRFPAMQKAGGVVAEVALHDGLIEILRRVSGFAHGVTEGYVFPSRQGYDKPFSNPSLSMSLKRAGYDLVPLDLGRAYKCWREQEGGGDLVAWWDKLRSTSGGNSS
ncbi:tyrosine-type recombinase/integrase [Loktanella sp. M215]|uniref:tyrosine-type recombinase/integrase n=1 Tax=Loktanella sp. M215 TaxID=2675431 RepID=UPI001F2D8713|nr:integrase arm-type DNA-binding domain-containing protein [Loktanella sp. M215]MCF7699950.1 DUF4102 domain-containing protein [Loktanella sp. M215]